MSFVAKKTDGSRCLGDMGKILMFCKDNGLTVDESWNLLVNANSGKSIKGISIDEYQK